MIYNRAFIVAGVLFFASLFMTFVVPGFFTHPNFVELVKQNKIALVPFAGLLISFTSLWIGWLDYDYLKTETSSKS